MSQFAQERFVIARADLYRGTLFLRLIKWRQQDVLSIKVEHSWASRRGIIESWNIKMQWRGLRTMLPRGRYPEGGERDGGGGNTADIENALPSAFAIPGIFFGDEGPGLGIPDAESGKKKKKKGGREKSYSTVQRRWISLCNGRENRLVRIVNDTAPCMHVRGWSLLSYGWEIISHSHFSRRNQSYGRNIWLAPALINFPGLILKVRTITWETRLVAGWRLRQSSNYTPILDVARQFSSLPFIDPGIRVLFRPLREKRRSIRFLLREDRLRDHWLELFNGTGFKIN